MPWVSDVRVDIGPHSATLLSPAPRIDLVCVAVLATIVAGLLTVRAVGPGHYLLAGAVLATGIATALIARARNFKTTFDGDAGQATVETHSMYGHSLHRYPFADIDSLMVTEGCVVELHLRDGTSERLTYAHQTYGQLDRMITAVCAATGIAKGSPNTVRAPVQDDGGLLSEPGMGLYVEGRFAILSTSTRTLSFRWRAEAVFDRDRREMTLVRTTPLRRARETVPLHMVESIGLAGAPDRETGIYAYRPLIRLKNKRVITLYGTTSTHEHYDRILAKLRELTGIGKEDDIVRPADHGARFRRSR
jgi:hypothetical protein